MKISNKTLIDSVESLNKINELSLPVKTAFAIAKATRTIEGMLLDYNKVLKKLQEIHVKRNKKGDPQTSEHATNPEIKHLVFKDRLKFNKAVDELLAIEVDLDLEPLSIDSLGEVDIKPSVLYNLAWLFV